MTQEWSISNFSYSLTRNIASHGLENLAFHSLLRAKMITLPNSHYPVGRMFFLNVEVKGLTLTAVLLFFTHATIPKAAVMAIWNERIKQEWAVRGHAFLFNPFTPKGPFTHAIFEAISDAISHTKRALPYPARMPFSRSIAWIGKKVITYYLKTPFFPIPANLTVFRRSVTRLKTPAG